MCMHASMNVKLPCHPLFDYADTSAFSRCLMRSPRCVIYGDSKGIRHLPHSPGNLHALMKIQEIKSKHNSLCHHYEEYKPVHMHITYIYQLQGHTMSTFATKQHLQIGQSSESDTHSMVLFTHGTGYFKLKKTFKRVTKSYYKKNKGNCTQLKVLQDEWVFCHPCDNQLKTC